jgi:hypothetical protein
VSYSHLRERDALVSQGADAVRWLDVYIDHLHHSSTELMVGCRLNLGPFSRIGATANLIICGTAALVALWTGITGQWAVYVVAAVLGVFEMVFVRVCVRAFRGDFDEFVLDSGEPDEPDSTS